MSEEYYQMVPKGIAASWERSLARAVSWSTAPRKRANDKKNHHCAPSKFLRVPLFRLKTHDSRAFWTPIQASRRWKLVAQALVPHLTFLSHPHIFARKAFMQRSAILLLTSVLVLIRPAQGSILWSSPHQITGITDVATNGILQEAYAFGPTTLVTSTTVNGVVFAPFANTGGTSETVGNITLATGTSDQIGSPTAGTFGSGSAPYASLSSSYQTLLGSGIYAGGSAPLIVTIAGLTAGQGYQVEFWVNDSRGGIGPFRTDTLTGTSPVILAFDTGGEGGLGQYVIGTFIATGTTQAFTVTGTDTRFANTAQIAAIEVAAVPEPSSMVMMGLGTLFLGFAGFHRRLAR